MAPSRTGFMEMLLGPGVTSMQNAFPPAPMPTRGGGLMGLLDGLLGSAPMYQRMQQPPRSQARGFSRLFDPEIALPMVGQLLGSNGNAGNIGAAFVAGGQALQGQKKRNQTVEMIRAKDPDLAAMIDGGMLEPGDGFKLFYDRQRKAQMPESYKVVGDRIFNTNDGSWISPPGAEANPETGLTTQLMQNENGEMIYVQPTKNGQLVRSKAPDGYRPVSPYDKSFQTKLGGEDAERAAGFAQAENKATTMLATLNQLEAHPGMSGAVGWQGALPDWMAMPSGTDEAGFGSVLNQVQGQAFLQAFESLKGGGQITEIEGRKATQAISRLNRSLSETEFKAAVEELRKVLTTAQDRARYGVVVDPSGRDVYRRGGLGNSQSQPGSGADPLRIR